MGEFSSTIATESYLRLSILVCRNCEISIGDYTITYLSGDEEYAVVDADDVIYESGELADCVKWIHRMYVGDYNQHVTVEVNNE